MNSCLRPCTHHSVVLCVTAVVFCCVSGCGSTDGDKAENIPKDSHEHGAVFLDPGDELSHTLTHDFIYRNPSNERVSLDVKTSCTCTEARLVKSTLMPNESTEFRLGVAIPYTRRRVAESALIWVRGVPEVSRTYEIRADVYPRIVVIPERRGQAQLLEDEPLDGSLRVIVYQGEHEHDWQVRVASLDSMLEMAEQSDVNTRIENGVRRKEVVVGTVLTLRNLGNAVSSERKGLGEANCEVSHGPYRYRHGFKWKRVRKINVVPEYVFVQRRENSDAPNERESARRVRLKLSSQTAFEVLRVEFCTQEQEPAILESTVSDGADEIVLVVELSGVELGDVSEDRGSIRIVTDHPEAPIVEIPVYAF